MSILKIGDHVDTKYGPGTVWAIEGTNITVNLVNNVSIVIPAPNGYSCETAESGIASKAPNRTTPQKRLRTKNKLSQPIIRSDMPAETLNEAIGTAETTARKKSQFDLLRAINSLRFGLVPEEIIEQITTNFDELERLTIDTLPVPQRPKPKVIEIVGQYGTGKTHSMAVIRAIARKQRYVTAHVEIDGQTISLSDPPNLLSSLWSSLEAEDLNSDVPLLEIYYKALDMGKDTPHFAPTGIDRILDNYSTIRMLRRKDIMDEFEAEYNSIVSSHNDITASEMQKLVNRHTKVDCYFDFTTVRPMIGREIINRPYDFLEDIFGHAKLIRLAGYNGLVVTIDEFEIEYNGMHFERVEALIDALTDYLSGQTKHESVPCTIYIATVNQKGHLGDEVVDQLVTASNGDRHSLEELGWDAINDLGNKLHSLYTQAFHITEKYDSAVARKLYKNAEEYSGRVRSFIKQYVAYMDTKFGPTQAF